MLTTCPCPPPAAPVRYAHLLAKHGYSCAGYQATVAEVVAQLGEAATAREGIGPATPTSLAAAVEEQLFHVACARLAPPALVLEILQAYFQAGGAAETAAATVHLLLRLGPLHEAAFYHPHPSPLPPQEAL